jgi:vanillate O-demethylase monooxygenase subunit
VPDFHSRLDDPDWKAVTGQTYAKCGYRLILDNLLDLSHLSYVHSSSTGNAAVAEQAVLTTEELDGQGVRVTRWMENIPPAPAFIDYAGYTGNMDRWQVSSFLPPSFILITNGSVDTGSNLNEEQTGSLGKWGFQVYHAMTPETETTTHQFWAVAHPTEFVDAAKLDTFQDQMRVVLKEDLDVYEAQQRAIDLDPDAVNRDANPRGTLPIDETLLKMRQNIRRLYGEEQKATKAP